MTSKKDNPKSLDQMTEAELALLSDDEMLALIGSDAQVDFSAINDDPDRRMLYFALRRSIVEKRKQDLAASVKGRKNTEDWEQFKDMALQEFYQQWGYYDSETKEITYKRSTALMLRAAESIFKVKGVDAVRAFDEHQQDLIANRIDRITRQKKRYRGSDDLPL